MQRGIRVLVVEDDRELRTLVAGALRRAGHDVAESGDITVSPAQLATVDAVVLDRQLPSGDGLTLVPTIRRAAPRAHVLVVSGLGGEPERVAGLIAGADDYLPKPISVRELVARIGAVARHLQREQPVVLRVGDLTIDLNQRLAVLGGRPLTMTRRELDLLAYLASNTDRVVSREELLRSVWSSSAEWQSPATVTEHVRRVRAKLEDADDAGEHQWIVAVRGSGYRFVAPASEPASHLDTATLRMAGSSIVSTTPEVARVLGTAGADELLGHDFMSFVAPRSVDVVQLCIRRLLAGAQPPPTVITLQRADGSPLHVEATCRLIDGRELIEASLWPLDDRRARLQELMTGIATEVSDAVIITTRDGTIERFNAAAEELYGWRESEVLGQQINDVVPNLDEESLAAARKAIFEHGVFRGRARQPRKDGTTVEIVATTMLIRDANGESAGIVTVNRRGDRAHDADDAAAAAAGDGVIDESELEVHYQPMVRLETGDVIGYEALARLRHPDRGLLLPASFIGEAERTGAIVELGWRVLDAAVRQLVGWRAAGRDLHVAVNLSTRQLDDDHLVARLAA
ncbi:MAG TPA: EAL domain-containing protein, partial [Acidimicrobiales bacterium]|nr:EAL domain-containing protein [Acidimicrobiales bacterium]